MRDNLITRLNPPSTQPIPANPKRGRKKRETFALYEASQQPELGLLFLLCVPIIASLSCFKEVSLGGVNYLVPLTLLTPLTMLSLVVVKSFLAPVRLTGWTGNGLWLVWYTLIWCSLFWCEELKSENLKHAFEMSTPYLFGLAGAMFVQSEKELKWLLNAIVFALVPSFACVLFWQIGLIQGGEFSVGPALDLRPHSMSLLPIAALAIACLPRTWFLPIVFWSACLFLSAIEGSRGVTLCILVLPMFHPGYKGLGWRLLLGVLIVCMALVVFYLPAMQERLFPETGSGTLFDLFRSKQSGMGRFEAWPLIFEKALEAPVLGHGVASAFDYVPTIWERMRSPHNEFLCVGYEFGAVGLLIYCSVMLCQLVLLRTSIRESQGTMKIAFTMVYLGLIAFNIMALTDNPLSSNIRFLNPLFMVMGAAYSCIKLSSSSKNDRVRLAYVK